jgi:pilus assembly protein CpaB
MKNKMILFAAVIFGLIAAGSIYYYLVNIKDTYRSTSNFTRVVVAGKPIPARTKITAQMVELKDTPSEYINKQALTKPEDVINKVAKADIFPGEQILSGKIAGEGEKADGLSYLLEQGKRAATIAVNEVSGLAGQLKPGDHIDIMGTFDLQGAVGQEKATYTSLLVQNATVLSTDQTTENSASDKKTAGPRTITVAVTPEQAQPLILCSEKGTIRVLLRPVTDQDIVSLPSTKTSQLLR